MIYFGLRDFSRPKSFLASYGHRNKIAVGVESLAAVLCWHQRELLEFVLTSVT